MTLLRIDGRNPLPAMSPELVMLRADLNPGTRASPDVVLWLTYSRGA